MTYCCLICLSSKCEYRHEKINTVSLYHILAYLFFERLLKTQMQNLSQGIFDILGIAWDQYFTLRHYKSRLVDIIKEIEEKYPDKYFLVYFFP